MNDRYIIEREFEHKGYKCVVTFGNMGHRCGYVGIPDTHPLFGEDYGNYLDIKKSDIEGREVSGVFQLLGAILDDCDKVKIEAYFQCHGGITYSGEVEKIPSIPLKAICGGSDLTAHTPEMEKICNLLMKSF